MNARDRATSVRVLQLRTSTRALISDENRALRDLSAWRGREAHRSMLLAFLTGYLGAFCDQIDRDDHTDPHEIAAVLRGVLDAVEADHRHLRETS